MEENKIDLFVYINKGLRTIHKTWKKAVICIGCQPSGRYGRG